jgi:hypothetical protein
MRRVTPRAAHAFRLVWVVRAVAAWMVLPERVTDPRSEPGWLSHSDGKGCDATDAVRSVSRSTLKCAVPGRSPVKLGRPGLWPEELPRTRRV